MVPAAFGVPVIAPVDVFNVAHDGKVPEPSAQWEYVPLPPMAVRVVE